MVRLAPARGAILVVLTLAGCAPDSEEAAAMLRQALASTRASATMSGATTTAPDAPPAAMPSPAPPPAGTRLRGTAPPATATALLGIGAEALRRMLGEPAIRRPEGGAEVWLYEAPACRLDVILYAEGPALTVGHAAARALGGTEGVTETACLAAIAVAAPPAPWTAPAPRA